MNNKIMIAMSGGVDSSVAAFLMKSQGFQCAGATMKLWDNNTNDIKDAVRVAKNLDMQHHVYDLTDEFKMNVVDYFINEYINCRTPNPCVVCNRRIKFGLFFNESAKRGFSSMATGHYAKIAKQGNRTVLQKATDIAKDQSYFLYSLSSLQLEHTYFPLGDMSKSEIREIAYEQNFINARKSDSQDVCFIPDGDYASFICDYTGSQFLPGEFKDRNGNILGRHSGIIRYTVGQRKGLGLSLGHPMYVCEKRLKENSIILCENSDLFSNCLDANDFNWSACDIPVSPLKAEAKIRYSRNQSACTVYPTGKDSVHIEFEQPQRAVTPGQAVVLYDGNTVIGGGTIL
jgi:tRNA-specific 2-thiouridylase